jgi:ATP-dependent RNA helicase DDX6/DHH1
LKDLLRTKKNLLDECEFFILDEADSLLKDKTERDIEEIISYLKKKCSLYMYSATFPIRIKSFKQKFMPEAQVVNLMD